jgi:Putative auto-transporter adhesin, head GIN domain
MPNGRSYFLQKVSNHHSRRFKSCFEAILVAVRFNFVPSIFSPQFLIKKRFIMKNLLAFSSFLFVFLGAAITHNLFAQNKMRPLTGNGIEKTARFDLKTFDQLEVLWLDGKIEVIFGAEKSDIEIISDENIFNLIKIKNTATGLNTGTLSLEIEGNTRNRLWLEDDKTRIKIRTTAQPTAIVYKANADASFSGLNVSKGASNTVLGTPYGEGVLKINKSGNGNITLGGSLRTLDITQDDNGSTNAEALVVSAASVRKKGNGALTLNVKKMETTLVSGNGGFFNVQDAPKAPLRAVKRISVTLFNPEKREKSYFLTGKNESGGTFSYGVSLKSMEKQVESLPVGTEIYRRRRLVATISEKDKGQIINL